MIGAGDILSRYPRPWEGQSNEDFFSAVQRFITVGYDSTTGISTLRVEAFAARDAQRLNDAMLAGGEALVNPAERTGFRCGNPRRGKLLAPAQR